MSKSIANKILAVMNGVEAVKKDKRNSFHNYKYASDEAVVTEIRDLLIKHKLVVIPNQKVCTQVGEITTLQIEYFILDPESGEQIVASVFGQGQDKGDKGVYKAATGAEKYFLLKTFLIPTSDDPEADGNGKTSGAKAIANGQESFSITTFVSDIKAFTSKNGKVYYKVMDSEGAAYTTFDKKVADLCKQAMNESHSVIISYEKDAYGCKITDTEVVVPAK